MSCNSGFIRHGLAMIKLNIKIIYGQKKLKKSCYSLTSLEMHFILTEFTPIINNSAIDKSYNIEYVGMYNKLVFAMVV